MQKVHQKNISFIKQHQIIRMTEKHQVGMANSVGGSLLTKSKEKIISSSATSDGEPVVRMVQDVGRYQVL